LAFQAHQDNLPFYLFRIPGWGGGEGVLPPADPTQESLAAGWILPGSYLAASCLAIRTHFGIILFLIARGKEKSLIILLMSSIISLNWPSSLRPPGDFHQNQFAVQLTGPVECVTTTVVTARNMLNELLALKTNQARLSDLSVQEYIDTLDRLGWRGLSYRFPTNFPGISIPLTAIELNPRGFMLPRLQALNALKRIAAELRQYYGCSFAVKQTSGNTLQDIATNLREGNLVLLSGLYESSNPVQNLLGGSPHTLGPVTKIDFGTGMITLLDTGPHQPLSTVSFGNFMQFWSRKSRLNLYTKPCTMTILIPGSSL
jgi:hypothetical protein